MTSISTAAVPLKELDDVGGIAHAAAELRKKEPHQRIEFTPAVKKIPGDRAGWKCSYRGCLRDTTGPTENEEGKSVSARTGMASHIHAAREGGPRWNPDLTEQQVQGRRKRHLAVYAPWECNRRLCPRTPARDLGRHEEGAGLRAADDDPRQGYQPVRHPHRRALAQRSRLETLARSRPRSGARGLGRIGGGTRPQQPFAIGPGAAARQFHAQEGRDGSEGCGCRCYGPSGPGGPARFSRRGVLSEGTS